MRFFSLSNFQKLIGNNEITTRLKSANVTFISYLASWICIFIFWYCFYHLTKPSWNSNIRIVMNELILQQVPADDTRLVRIITDNFVVKGNDLDPLTRDRLRTELSSIVDRALGHMRDGVFIESGTGAKRKYSHSAFFEKRLNWTGLVIEPDPVKFDKLKKQRRNVFLLPACISDKPYPELVSYNEIASDEYLIEDDLSDNQKDGYNDYYTSEEMEQYEPNPYLTITCFPIQSILLALAFNSVDYLSVHNDYDQHIILKHFPFHKYDVRAVTVDCQQWPGGPIALDYFMRQKNFTFYKVVYQSQSAVAVYIKRKTSLSGFFIKT